MFAAEARDLSLLHFLFYVHAGTSFDALLSTARGAQEQRFLDGPQALSVRIAADLGDAVWLEAPVRRIRQDDHGVAVTTDRGEVAGAYAVVAVPPTLAGRISYDPLLPAARDQLTQRMPMGSVIKVHVRYDEPFWRGDGLTGQATSDRGAVRVTFDNSPPDGATGTLLAFIEGAEARHWSAQDPADRHRVVIADLVRYFGRRAGDYSEIVEQDWSAEEWTRGCYGAHLAPGVWTAYGHALRTPCGRIHWAGTETASVWTGYLDGAVRSGERAASDLTALLGATAASAPPP